MDLPIGILPTSLWQTRGSGDAPGLYNPNEAFDRAQYIETRVNFEWDEPEGEISSRRFASAWPGPPGDVPALILMATGCRERAPGRHQSLALRPAAKS